MPMDTIRVVRATQDEDASTLGLLGTVYLWGFTARNSGTATANVLLEDNLVAAGTNIKVDYDVNPTGFDAATTFDEQFGLMFPAPVKFTTGVSANVTNVDVLMLYVQGGD
ncbi:MAG: hypothetical protein MN733_36995 [Nitrososphaera sp.]|nr:hypothetical protein [Nitrososphaera sp.]